MRAQYLSNSPKATWANRSEVKAVDDKKSDANLHDL